MVITKDLSRLGRDYIMTGYYSEIFFPSKEVRYIAIADGFDSLNGSNEIAPFQNILNDMYARDISRKVKNAKRQHAKDGRLVASHAPYGYRKDKVGKMLLIDPEAAETVRKVFALALEGFGEIAIAKELESQKIPAPSYYKYQNGETRFAEYGSVKENTPYRWSYGTISKILKDPVYTGTLVSLKQR